jgi:hypothetical protein
VDITCCTKTIALGVCGVVGEDPPAMVASDKAVLLPENMIS